MNESAFRFVDLFAGVGGFHAALAGFGGRCVYAVEIDKTAAEVYRLNWGYDPLGDITQHANDDVMEVGEHEILCAGFPCQPFSKSGSQRGMHETRGTLYWNILRIIQERRPLIVMLENVRNLAGPRHRHEWQVIIETLRDEGYQVASTPAVFSPHTLPPELGGRPQVRERVFLTATRIPADLAGDPQLTIEPPPIQVPVTFDKNQWNVAAAILDDSHNSVGCELSESERLWIDAWDDFVQILREANPGARLPGFPIWVESWSDFERPIPGDLPSWKRSHLAKNYALYGAHKDMLDAWVKRWDVLGKRFPPSRRKLEWQAQSTPRLWDTVMHMRPSGIRAKAPTYLPALVAITQTSIIGPRERRLSPRETARLQGLPDTFEFGGQKAAETYKQMGNGVNVGVVWNVLREHVRRDEWLLKYTESGQRVIRAVLDAPLSPDAILATHRPAE